MAEAAVRRHASAAPAGPSSSPGPLREGSGPTAPPHSDGVLTQLVRYIPTELVAAYTAVAGVLPTTSAEPLCGGDFTVRWVAFAVFAVLTPVAVWATYLVKRRSAVSTSTAFPLFEMIVALAAFGAWALILPLAPINSVCSWRPDYGLAGALTILFLIGLATRLRG